MYSEKALRRHPGRNPQHRYGASREKFHLGGLTFYGPKNPGRWIPHQGEREINRRRPSSFQHAPTNSPGKDFARAEIRRMERRIREKKMIAVAREGSATAARERHKANRRRRASHG